MPDHMDAIQERCLREQEAVVARIERSMTGGLGACEDCGEPISDLRRSLGARRCLGCQSALEARAHR
jgi:RNA polymerase-binding transcription factor DksA